MNLVLGNVKMLFTFKLVLVHGLRGNIVNSATIFVFTRINHLEITGFIMICTQPHMMNGKIENNAYSAAFYGKICQFHVFHTFMHVCRKKAILGESRRVCKN